MPDEPERPGLIDIVGEEITESFPSTSARLRRPIP